MILRPILTLKMLLISSFILSVAATTPYSSCSDEDFELAENYIKSYLKIAIDEMDRAGIPASIIIAQGMLESSFGQSELAQSSNNHFGIKCAKDWEGDSYYHRTREYRNGREYTERHCFRAYESVKNSYKDHSEHLLAISNYDNLFAANRLDYKFWAEGLYKSGYATDPAYTNKLIRLIEQYDLARYDIPSHKYDLPTEELIREFNADPTTKMDREVLALHVRIDQLENSIAEAKKYQAQILTLQADLNKKIDGLKIQQEDTRLALNNQITQLKSNSVAQNELITEMEAKLQKVKTIQKAMLKIDPLANHFNEDGTPRSQVVIFPTRHHNFDGVFYQSGKKATTVKSGQNFEEISESYSLPIEDLRRFNDLRNGEEELLPTGCYIYLEPKANMVTDEQGPHVVQIGENMLLISQRYGIKLSKLYQRNKMKRGEEPEVGEFIFLNKKNKVKPRLHNSFKSTVSETFDRFGGGGSK